MELHENITKKVWWNFWEISEDDLKKQVEQYGSLKFYQSYRGIVVLAFIGFTILSLLVVSLIPTPFLDLRDLIVGTLIYAPFLILIFFGQRWAIIVLMILYTYDKAYTLIWAGNISPVIWWVLGMILLYRALKVENVRAQMHLKQSKNFQISEG